MELLLDSQESDGISLVLSVAGPDAVWCFEAEENQSCRSLGALGSVGALLSPLGDA